MSDGFIELENDLGYTFTNGSLLTEAFIHRSFAHEKRIQCTNERLEFLGDSVLHLILAEYLLGKYTALDEGDLSALRSYCESEPFLYDAAVRLDIGKYISFGKGESLAGGRYKKSLLADTFEALIGAIYIDGGYKSVVRFVKNHMLSYVDTAYEELQYIDCKSELQKYTQKNYNKLPQYELIDESGPEHDKSFTVVVEMLPIFSATGVGKTKKDAEKVAAQIALKQLSKKDSDK